ncbi:MAG: glutamate synthase subunit alpha, partial [Lachnospirales bacterium]
SAGQSFGAFLYKGITMKLTGDSNDYVAKGLSGGKLIITPPKESTFSARDNIIVGNVSLYGAISGEVYINGLAGQRFAIRNSGAIAVVEGIGENGCEYMTGGEVVILGKVGRNFAAGMSGGVAYIYNKDNNFEGLCNKDFVHIEKLEEEKDILRVKELINKHVINTDSSLGKEILQDFENIKGNFVKVIPKTYKKVMTYYNEFLAKGLDQKTANEKAFLQLMEGGK